MNKLKPGKNNKEDRMNFVIYWANYVKNNPDVDWSKQQNIIINSQIKNAKLTPKQYLKRIKLIPKTL